LRQPTAGGPVWGSVVLELELDNLGLSKSWEFATWPAANPAIASGRGHSPPPCAGPWHPDATRPPAAASDQGPELLEFERVYPAASRMLSRV